MRTKKIGECDHSQIKFTGINQEISIHYYNDKVANKGVKKNHFNSFQWSNNEEFMMILKDILLPPIEKQNVNANCIEYLIDVVGNAKVASDQEVFSNFRPIPPINFQSINFHKILSCGQM